jgi:hypothetical protein
MRNQNKHHTKTGNQHKPHKNEKSKQTTLHYAIVKQQQINKLRKKSSNKT